MSNLRPISCERGHRNPVLLLSAGAGRSIFTKQDKVYLECVRTMQGQEQLYVPTCFAWYEVPLNELAKGRIVERRKAKRNQIQVDIEIAHPGAHRCGGYAENISRTGVSIILWDGEFPTRQRSVILNFKVWTGSETLYRKIYARVVRLETEKIALEFAEHDFIAEAIIHDLMFYQSRERRTGARAPAEYDKTVAVSTAQAEQTV